MTVYLIDKMQRLAMIENSASYSTQISVHPRPHHGGGSQLHPVAGEAAAPSPKLPSSDQQPHASATHSRSASQRRPNPLQPPAVDDDPGESSTPTTPSSRSPATTKIRPPSSIFAQIPNQMG
ncbi:hypothetical protein ACLOJK_030622 [Asimina triloba]